MRLGLQPLAYLWERERMCLLNEMVDIKGVHAILVKVAGAGLEPSKHLGKSLLEMSPTLTRLHHKYGLDVCGEGGEYETLVLDCSVYKKRLELINTRVVLDKEDVSVGHLKILEWQCVDKVVETNNNIINTSIMSSSLQDTINQFLTSDSHTIDTSKSSSSTQVRKVPRIVVGVDGIGQTPIVSPSPYSDSIDGSIIQNQVKEIMIQFKEMLTSIQSDLADIVFVHLYISDIKYFGIINEEYCKWFGRNPPSRSCVACPLPIGVYVSADATFLESSHCTIQLGRSSRRQVLHVRSVSDWAPVCIGPYAQANVLMDMYIYVSGQIPLNPATMTIWSPDPSNIISNVIQQLALCIRHSGRVLTSLNSSLKQVTLCTVYLDAEKLKSQGFTNWAIIQKFVKEILLKNCCEAIYNNEDKALAWSRAIDTYGNPDSEDESDESDKVLFAPIVLIGVKGIPRDALVEVEVSATTNVLKEDDFESTSFIIISERRKASTNYDNILSWPIWKSEAKAKAKQTASTDYAILKGQVSLLYLPRCVCSGVIEICFNDVNTTEYSLNMIDVVHLIRDCLNKVIMTSSADMLFLKQFKVFYPTNSMFEYTELLSLLSSQLSMNEEFPLPLLIVPIVRLQEDIILSVSFSFINLLQMKSEAYINGE